MDHGAAKEISLLLLVHQKTDLLLMQFGFIISFGTPIFPFTSNFVSHLLVVWILVFFITKSMKFQNINAFIFQ